MKRRILILLITLAAVALTVVGVYRVVCWLLVPYPPSMQELYRTEVLLVTVVGTPVALFVLWVLKAFAAWVATGKDGMCVWWPTKED